MSCGCCGGEPHVDPRALVRNGTHQGQRTEAAPDPARLQVDGHGPEDAMVFAARYARHLPYVTADGVPQGTWEPFFTADLSARLAAVATDDVADYRTTVNELLRQLEDPELPASEPAMIAALGSAMIAALGSVFDCVGTLALRLDELKENLPDSEPLRGTLGTLVRARLGPELRKLIGYYRAGTALGVVDPAAPLSVSGLILGRAIVPFNTLVTGPGLSPEWPASVGVPDWTAFRTPDLTGPTAAYGTGATAVDRVNHLATHNLFTAACEAFLGAYARVVEDAGTALRKSFTTEDHQPHYALFLAFLRLLQHARAALNTLPRKHLDFYYRDVLRLAERPARPERAHALVELARRVDAHLVVRGRLITAGGERRFAVDRDLVANQAAVDELLSLYRHENSSPAETLPFAGGRIYAAPVVEDDGSWHPFARKTYRDSALHSIDMPPAEVGFAVASHHLWLSEGDRTITFRVGEPDHRPHKGLPTALLRCRLTTAEGWLDRDADEVTTSDGGFAIKVRLDPNDPPITPYDPAVHAYTFATAMPILLVTLRTPDDAAWSYSLINRVQLGSPTLSTRVEGLRTLSLANDQGPIDPAKPFLAFGSAPGRDSSLVIGSKEAFQKGPVETRLSISVINTPNAHGAAEPTFAFDYLNGGTWHDLLTGTKDRLGDHTFGRFDQPAGARPDLTPNETYSTTSRGGFIRVTLDRGYGTDTYPVELAKWIALGAPDDGKPDAPVLPMVGTLTLGYDAIQKISLTDPSDATGRFFHVTPFGLAEQHSTGNRLLPAFLAGPGPNGLTEPAVGELYLGMTGLEPPQNLSLLFQVVDGTANPLTSKPDRHLRWSYLRGDEWVPLADDAVGDVTDGFLASGIVTVAVPADATTQHHLMPAGRHWLRVAVATAPDAVCRLVGVAAQALSATATTSASSGALPSGTLGRLDPPDAAVKAVRQPYPGFGGRASEVGAAFATRVSERLRHKDRAITVWDYEHLVLEAFPRIYQARCLNHTRYEPTTCGVGTYDELAPGHVTVVTIPDLSAPNPRDPLRPYTSLRDLGEIDRFLRARMPCFAQLHVRNPQFEEVRVALKVRLRNGFDETFHLDRIRHDITEFLSPWAYRAGSRPKFNGTVHRSALVHFLEERPYVDYLTDVQLFRKLPDASVEQPFPEAVVGSRAVSILVSARASAHDVKAIPDIAAAAVDGCDCPPEVTS